MLSPIDIRRPRLGAVQDEHVAGVVGYELADAEFALTTADAPAQADVAPENFAQADDIAQIDTNNDGTIDRNEFVAACAKGLVHVPARSNR
jgi:hypothetical protein